MGRLKELALVKQEIAKTKSELLSAQNEYRSIVNAEPYMKNKMKGRQRQLHKLKGKLKSLEKEMTKITKEQVYDACGVIDEEANPYDYNTIKYWEYEIKRYKAQIEAGGKFTDEKIFESLRWAEEQLQNLEIRESTKDSVYKACGVK